MKTFHRRRWGLAACSGMLALAGFCGSTGLRIPSAIMAAEADNSGAAGKKATESLPPEVADPIVKVRLFKNGLAELSRNIHVPNPGTFTLKHVPAPVHGTFWLDAPMRQVQVQAASGVRKVPLKPGEEPEVDNPNLQPWERQNLISIRESRLLNPYGNQPLLKAVRGKKATFVVQAGDDKTETVSGTATGMVGSLLQVQTAEGLVLLPEGQIIRVKTDALNDPDPQMTDKPYLDLTVPVYPEEEAALGLTLQMDYLGYGLTWAPAYRIDLSRDDQLKIDAQAVLRNEIEDINDAEFELISGFPSIKFSTIPSLITPGVTLAEFFNPRNDNGRMRYEMQQQATQQALFSNSVQVNRSPNADIFSGLAAASGNLSNTGGDAIDIFFKNIGKISLKKNTAKYVPLETGTAPYEKVAMWEIPNNRDWLGRVQERQQHRYYNDGTPREDEADSVWDAVKFKNPFTFPLTTAATSFYRSSRFVGENMSHFTSPGEETIINITKALSVRASVVESEEGRQNSEDYFYVYGYRVQKRNVNVEMRVKNYRPKPVKLIIQKTLAGNLLEQKQPQAADSPAPEKRLTADLEQNINQIWELKWTLDLQPGEEKTIPYRYQVIVYYP